MFYPMSAMVFLTVCIGFYLMSMRISMSRSGAIDPRIFKLNKSKELPDKLVQAANNYTNLFEVPLLFYIACITSIVMGTQNSLLIALAWLFVASRVAHSYIHLTNNKIIPRLVAFVTGVLTVLVMWIILLLQVISR